MGNKELLDLLRRAEAICGPDADGAFSEVVNAFGRLMGERDKAIEERDILLEGNNDLMRMIDDTTAEAVRFQLERDAAVKVLQRFSYDNTHKCRWCKFAKPAVMGRVICGHPALHVRHKYITDALPFYPRCTRFEYVYREENAK